MITFELTLKNEDQKFPKKPKIQSCITQFFKSNKKWVLSDLMLKKYKRFIFPKSSSSPNNHIFVSAKRMCLLWEKCLLWEGTVNKNIVCQYGLEKYFEDTGLEEPGHFG